MAEQAFKNSKFTSAPWYEKLREILTDSSMSSPGDTVEQEAFFLTKSVVLLSELFQFLPVKKNPIRAQPARDELSTLSDALQQIELGNMMTLDQKLRSSNRSR